MVFVANVDLYIAIRRKKDNPSLPEKTIRHIIRDEERDLQILTEIVKQQDDGGIWRIYKTINKRNTEVAFKQFQHKMIENPEIHERLESEWKTCLLQEKCKATNYILIDIDTKDQEVFSQVFDLLGDNIQAVTSTPNGFHIVCNRIDLREVEKIDDVEIKRDALVFIGVVE